MGMAPAQKAVQKQFKTRTSVKTEILFLERVHAFLKPGTGPRRCGATRWHPNQLIS